MMKVLVTGGAGFIGSHTVKLLREQGYQVVVVDRLAGALVPGKDESVSIYQLDLVSEKLERVFETERPDCVIHLAAQISVQRSLKDPCQDAESNIMGTIHLLTQCVRYGVKKLVFASSAAVYGTPESIPIQETDKTDPQSFYGVSKLVAERYIHSFAVQYGLDYVILRYANVYGFKTTRSGEDGVITAFVERILSGQPLEIFGSGEQTRDFVHVQDVAHANVLAIRNGSRDIVNISGGGGISLLEIVGLLRELSGVEPALHFLPPQPGDIGHSVMCNRKAAEKLNWMPYYTLRDGLHTLLRHEVQYREGLNRNPPVVHQPKLSGISAL
ncbi:NAD-dependent epimerase/dehydratase family protein [Paenibacillus sanfengchensis]|uniref:NAD-dependent epimerase/dehydratase family protein n=1 Tax=Paenibacillus sanfengchensis TaxID=3119819 RepID=UPI002FE2585B